jgi:hypothetical protein
MKKLYATINQLERMWETFEDDDPNALSKFCLAEEERREKEKEDYMEKEGSIRTFSRTKRKLEAGRKISIQEWYCCIQMREELGLEYEDLLELLRENLYK